MGEVEAPAPVEGPQVSDGAVAVEISEGANKGELPSKPPKRLPKPNKEEMVAKANVLHETIKARKARIEEINSIISGKNRQSESPELVQLKNKLQALRAQWDAELVCLAFLHLSSSLPVLPVLWLLSFLHACGPSSQSKS